MRIPAIPRAGIGRAAAVFVPLTLLPVLFNVDWIVNIAFFTLMYAALATAWNLLGGFLGYISLGNVMFFGSGAYALGITFQHVSIGSGWLPFAVVPLVGIGVALASIPIGLVAYRTRGLSFVIVTVTGVVIFEYLAFNLTSVTGGPPGLAIGIPTFSVANYDRIFYWAMLVIFALAIFGCWWVSRTRLGSMMFAIRDDEDKALGVGIVTLTPKLIAFAASAGLSAMVGAVWAYYIANIYPQFAFDPEFLTVSIVLLAFLGGTGTIWGPMVGALIIVPAQQYLAYAIGGSQWYLVGYAGVFIVTMLVLPRGVLTSITDWVDRRRRGRSGGANPSHTADGAMLVSAGMSKT